MLRRKKESKKNIPKEARRSLEILDDVINKYDDKDEAISRSESFIYIKARPTNDDKQAHPKKNHEDVRRSLEILDNVLAEFDDGIGDLSAFPTIRNEGQQQVERTQFNGETEVSTPERNYETEATDFYIPQYSANSLEAIQDGATSQTELLSLEDKMLFSPPPVPKRSPATRLSSREDLTLSESYENIYANSFEIRRNVFDIQDGYRSANQGSKVKQKIKTDYELSLSSKLSNQPSNADVIPKKNSSLFDKDNNSTSADDNDDVFVSRSKLTLCRSASASMMMTADALQKSPNIASRRALYEKSNIVGREDVKRPVIHSDSGEATFSVRNSPFLKKKFPIISSPRFHKRNVSDSTYCHQTFEENHPPRIGIHRSQTFKDTSPMILNNSSNARFLKETKEERIARLNKKFAEVRHLLKTKQIKPLDCGAPRFIPTPPPQKVPRKYDVKANGPMNRDGSQCDRTQSDPNLQKDSRVPKPPVTLVSTISDISCMLPTDTLNRPHLGLNYCMEDDLSPGVKELLTSTPKSDKCSLEFSTFSQSFSSLGYSSGQSDSDLNLSLNEENKQIPISTLKSHTLPIGMKLGPPFNYTTDINYDCDTEDHVKVESSNIQNNNESDNNHFRSSSAPPMKHLLQRKNKFGMSKKELKDKTKNKDDSVSLKSNLSLDDGIVLRKITALDSSTETKDFSTKKQTSASFEEKTKRKSVWKSILRRK